MLRAIRVLLAVALLVPAPSWAANRSGPRGPQGPARLTPGPRTSGVPIVPLTVAPELRGEASLPEAAAPAPALAPIVKTPEERDREIALTLGELQVLQRQTAPAPGNDALGASALRFDGAQQRGYGVMAAGDEAANDSAFQPQNVPETGGPQKGRRRRGPKPRPEPSDEADDGGGAKYPHRSVTFRGEEFRSVYFRPNVPTDLEIVRAIDKAETSIHLALYEFKSGPILEALRRARGRGVRIHLILDYGNVFPRHDPDSDYKPKRSKEVWALVREGFDVKVLPGFAEYGINHNKVAVIDHDEKQSLSIFGSYNWSFTAEHSHYENAHFETDKERVTLLKKYWDWMDSLAQPEKLARDYKWADAPPPLPFDVPETIAFNDIMLPKFVMSPERRAGKSIEDRLVAAIDASKKSIDMSIFSLRSTKVVEALVRASKRPGMTVRVIVDQSQATSEVFGAYAQWLAFQGVDIRLLAGPDPKSDFQMAQKSHHKFTIFDGKLLETGSANYTKSAAKANFENSHFLDDKKDVAGYKFVYERMFKRAEPMEKPDAEPKLQSDADLEAAMNLPRRPAPPPHPAPPPLNAKPRPIKFRGQTFPSFAFRPDTAIEPLIAKAIRSARKSIRLDIYEFKLESVLEALREAKKKGRKIEIVVDQSHVYTRGKNSRGEPRMPSNEIQALINEGFDIVTLKGEKSGIMHNKLLVLDAETDEGLVMWGSYNLARTAEDNHYENVMFSNDAHDVKDYLNYHDYMRDLASPIDRKKLDETLNRTTDVGLSAAGDADQVDEERDSKFPPPPRSTAPQLTFNGQTFDRRYFSPQGGILDAWLRAIDAAETSIEIAMFGFYSRRIADALVARMARAQAEGKTIEIKLSLDSGQSALARFDDIPVAQWLAQKGLDVRIEDGPNQDQDPMFEKQHNKFMILDRKLLMTGSYNISDTAENNSFENENLTMDPLDVAGYAEYFTRRLFENGWLPRGAKKAEVKNKVQSGFAGF